MTKLSLNAKQPNEAWILHREEVNTVQDGACNIYVLLDAYSTFCFGQEISVDLPSSSSATALLKTSIRSGWPVAQEIIDFKKRSIGRHGRINLQRISGAL